MRRFDNWHALLSDHIKAASGRPFSWGEFDCCTFACDGVLAMTGTDPMEAMRGRYSSGMGAVRALKAFCGGGLEAAADRIAAILSAPQVDPLMAQRGDVVLARHGDFTGMALGLVSMNGRYGLFASQVGLAVLPLRDCMKAWRV